MPRDADRPDAADIVLVHGTTQAPSGWQLLSAELTERGHRVQSVDLPVDLPELCAEDYAEIIGKQCGVVHRPVVLAHSAAGLLLPSISRRLNASHLIWLSATIPDPTGRTSFTDEVRSHGPEMFNAEWLTLTEPPTVDPVVSAYFLFHDCSLQTLRWALSTRRLFYPRRVYNQPPGPLGDLPPSTFILPRAGRSLRPEWMRQASRDRLGVEPIEIDAGHCPHVSRPAEVARIIEAIL